MRWGTQKDDNKAEAGRRANLDRLCTVACTVRLPADNAFLLVAPVPQRCARPKVALHSRPEVRQLRRIRPLIRPVQRLGRLGAAHRHLPAKVEAFLGVAR